jgi:hypothetical protein
MGFAEGLYNNPLPMDRRRSHPSQEYASNLVVTKRGSASALVRGATTSMQVKEYAEHPSSSLFLGVQV